MKDEHYYISIVKGLIIIYLIPFNRGCIFIVSGDLIWIRKK